MIIAEQLLAAQDHRLRELDPALPGAVAPPQGDTLTATSPDGTVAGVLRRVPLPVLGVRVPAHPLKLTRSCESNRHQSTCAERCTRGDERCSVAGRRSVRCAERCTSLYSSVDEGLLWVPADVDYLPT